MAVWSLRIFPSIPGSRLPGTILKPFSTPSACTSFVQFCTVLYLVFELVLHTMMSVSGCGPTNSRSSSEECRRVRGRRTTCYQRHHDRLGGKVGHAVGPCGHDSLNANHSVDVFSKVLYPSYDLVHDGAEETRPTKQAVK